MKGAGVAIAALVAWVLTVAAGVYLLTSVIAAERASARPPAASTMPGDGTTPATTPVASAAGMPAPVTSGAGPYQAGEASAPLAARRAPAPFPRTKVSAPPGKHPFLEFCHPALGIAGLACWFAFVGTHDRAFAWVAVAVLVATIGAGLGWLAAHARSARRQAGGGSGPAVRAHRVVLHGLAAAATCGLTVIAILAASHG